MRYFFSFIIVSILLTGCGRKGQLIPPEALVPAPVNDLTATQKGESFLISWTVPGQDGGGRPIRDISHFRLFKREVLPPDQDCEVCPNAYRTLKDVYPDYLRDTRRSGERLFISDGGIIADTTYQYKVVSYLKDGTPSLDSNKFRLMKVVPLPAPRLKALPTPTSINIHWEGTDLPPNVKIKGYNLYRWRTNDPPALFPLNDAPIQGTEFEDFRLQRGTGYTYVVRSVTDTDGVLIESVSSNEVTGAMTEPE